MDEDAEFARLIEGLRSGDNASIGVLCKRYASVLRAAVRRRLHPQLRTRFDSLDFVQDVWAAFLATPTDRYNFDTPNALVAYLIRIAQHRVVDVVRERFDTERDNVQREVAVDTVAQECLPAPTATPSQWMIAGEEWERVLSQFSPGHQKVLERLREGYSIDDIARMVNISPRTIARIVGRLKDCAGL